MGAILPWLVSQLGKLRLVDHHRARLQQADAHVRRPRRETQNGIGRSDAAVQRQDRAIEDAAQGSCEGAGPDRVDARSIGRRGEEGHGGQVSELPKKTGEIPEDRSPNMLVDAE
jgi:hypothetical protein